VQENPSVFMCQDFKLRLFYLQKSNLCVKKWNYWTGYIEKNNFGVAVYFALCSFTLRNV